MLDSLTERISRLEQEIKEYFSRIENISSLLDINDFPKDKIIYHYTSATGLLGIFQSQTIWATEASYLNDSQEIKYGIDLARAELDQLSKQSNSKDHKKLVDEVAKNLSTFSKSAIYVSCFCEDGDLLSQWKGYSGKGYSGIGAGFSIGLNIDQLSKSRYELSTFPIRIKKVVYDNEIQKKILWDECNATLGYFDAWLEKYPNEDDVSIFFPAAVAGLTEYIKLQSARFKASTFHEENEWRFIYVPSLPDAKYQKLIKFRTEDDRIIPYLEFQLQLPAISRIVCGSKIDLESSKKAIDLIYNRASSFNGVIIPLPQMSASKISLQ